LSTHRATQACFARCWSRERWNEKEGRGFEEEDGKNNVDASGNHVSTSNSTHRFAFESFYNGDFGIDWWDTKGSEARISSNVSYAGEEWELVN